jgi:hypothetical protein
MYGPHGVDAVDESADIEVVQGPSVRFNVFLFNILLFTIFHLLSTINKSSHT